VDAVTFGLAVAAYGSLALDAAMGVKRVLSIPTAVVAVTHVVLVWHGRFHWSLATATTRGWAGFIVFHSALALIVAAAAAPGRWAERCVYTAFPVVTVGAVSAVFRYDWVAAWRWPVVAIAALGATALVRRLSLRRKV